MESAKLFKFQCATTGAALDVIEIFDEDYPVPGFPDYDAPGVAAESGMREAALAEHAYRALPAGFHGKLC